MLWCVASTAAGDSVEPHSFASMASPYLPCSHTVVYRSTLCMCHAWCVCVHNSHYCCRSLSPTQGDLHCRTTGLRQAANCLLHIPFFWLQTQLPGELSCKCCAWLVMYGGCPCGEAAQYCVMHNRTCVACTVPAGDRVERATFRCWHGKFVLPHRRILLPRNVANANAEEEEIVTSKGQAGPFGDQQTSENQKMCPSLGYSTKSPIIQITVEPG
jgi:hypothetical protein